MWTSTLYIQVCTAFKKRNYPYPDFNTRPPSSSALCNLYYYPYHKKTLQQWELVWYNGDFVSYRLSSAHDFTCAWLPCSCHNNPCQTCENFRRNITLLNMSMMTYKWFRNQVRFSCLGIQHRSDTLNQPIIHNCCFNFF